MFPIVFFYGLISGVFTFGKQAILYIKPFFLTAVRLPFAGAIMLMIHRLYCKEKIYFHRPSVRFLWAYGISLFIGDAFRFIAMLYIPAANSALIAATGPFITALVAHFFLNELITLKKTFALLLGFISVSLLLINNLLLPNSSQSLFEIIFGYSAAFLSVLSFVVVSYALKILISKYHYSSLNAAGLGTIMGGFVGLVFSYAYEAWHISNPVLDLQSGFPLLALLFIGHNVIGYPIYAYLINKYPITLVSFGQLLLPIFTVILRYFLFGDAIPTIFIASVVLLSFSFYIFYAD